MELLPVVALVGGSVCLYGAIKNKNPIGVITAALTGKPLDSVAPLMQDSSGGGGLLSPDPLPGVVPKDKVPESNTPGGGFDPPPDDSWIPSWLKPLKDLVAGQPQQGVVPVMPGERGSAGNGAV